MSRIWGATANGDNYLYFTTGTDTAASFPYSYACFVKASEIPAAGSISVFAHSGGTNNARYGCMNIESPAADGWPSIFEMSETFQARGYYSDKFGSRLNEWVPVVGVVTSATSRTIYFRLSTQLSTGTEDQGSSPEIRQITIGGRGRGALGTLDQACANLKIARVAIWRGVALSESEVASYIAGTAMHEIQSAYCWGAWPLNGDNLNDVSGNNRHLTLAGTVTHDTDEPYTWSESVTTIPEMEALYYGAARLDSKTNISWAVRAGHQAASSGILGALLGGGTSNGATNASGLFVWPEGEALGDLGAVSDPVTVHLYWKEGSEPTVDRSLIVETTLIAAP